MKSNRSVYYSLLIVVLAHLGVFTALAYGPTESTAPVIEPPTITGVIIASEPVIKSPEALPPPPPKVEKPHPQVPLPLPKAPASDRAIKQETLQETALQPSAVEQQPAQQVAAPVTPPQADVSQLNNPAPVYPSQSRRLHEEGVVILEVLVKADGSLGDMKLKVSSGYSRLDEAAQRAVKNWHFVPAKRGGEAIDFWYELPIEFSLTH